MRSSGKAGLFAWTLTVLCTVFIIAFRSAKERRSAAFAEPKATMDLGLRYRDIARAGVVFGFCVVVFFL